MESCLEFCATSQQSSLEPMSRQIVARNVSRPCETNHDPVGQSLLIEMDFDPEAEKICKLAPDMRLDAANSDLYEAERDNSEIFRDLVDALHIPIVIVSADMQILFSNASAERMLRDDEIIHSRRGRLDFQLGFAGNTIKQAVAASKYDEFTLVPLAINVPLLRGQTPTVAHVIPLARCAHPRRASQAAVAAILIAIAGYAPVPAIDAIGALFGLTPAEKIVATHLVAGRRASEIAELNGASENTIRTQIRALFDKTHTNNQRDLITLIKDLTPPVSVSLYC